jgi:hypothetical protein
MKLLLGPVLLIATASAGFAESLEKRFGPDRERGYRAEREYDRSGRGFKNVDRANFLGTKRPADSEIETLRPDLQLPSDTGQEK